MHFLLGPLFSPRLCMLQRVLREQNYTSSTLDGAIALKKKGAQLVSSLTPLRAAHLRTRRVSQTCTTAPDLDN